MLFKTKRINSDKLGTHYADISLDCVKGSSVSSVQKRFLLYIELTSFQRFKEVVDA